MRPATRVVDEPPPRAGQPGARATDPGRADDPLEDPAAPAVAPDRAEPPVLGAEHLTVRFRTGQGSMTAVDDVSLSCHRGEVVALVGQSGSGKTTLARTLLGLHRADTGQVLFGGEPLPSGPKSLSTRPCGVRP